MYFKKLLIYSELIYVAVVASVLLSHLVSEIIGIN